MAGPGVSQPISTVVVASAAVTTSSQTANLKNTTGQILAGDAVDLWLNCTNNAASAGAQVAVYLDISPDNGTTWLAAEKFATVTLSTGTAVIHFRPTGIGAVEAASFQWSQTTTGSTHVVNNIVLPPDQRIRYELINDGHGGSSATFAVYAITQPVGAGRF